MPRLDVSTTVRWMFALGLTIAYGSSFRDVRAADWPMWRADAQRSGATTQQLAPTLHVQWERDLGPQQPAWPEDPRIGFDASYHPVILGTTLFIASSRNDSLTAFDTRTGAEKWTFLADGPVRFAPVAIRDRVYFGADDGCFYCLTAADGKLIWKFDAVPNRRKVLGNDRLISVWPVRGGAVPVNGKIYFTAGVWPFEGTFLYALDLNDNAAEAADSSNRAPIASVTTLVDRTPQGYLAVDGSKLYIPGGRAAVSGFDLQKARLDEPYKYRTEKATDYHVVPAGRWLFHGGASYDFKTDKLLTLSARRPVVTPTTVYFGNDHGNLVACSLDKQRTVELTDRRGRPLSKTEITTLWELKNEAIRDVPAQRDEKWHEAHPLELHLLAGNRLYGHQDNEIFAVDLPAADGKPVVSWKTRLAAEPTSLAAADERLFAVTRDGRLSCFGAETVEPKQYPLTQTNLAAASDAVQRQAAELLEQSRVRDGFALVWGAGNGPLIEELVRQSALRVIALTPAADEVDALRRRWNAAGLYGKRIAVRHGDPLGFEFPPYLADLIVVNDAARSNGTTDRALVSAAFQSLRPYGGVACIASQVIDHKALSRIVAEEKLAGAELKQSSSGSLLVRAGALPGSADWTHEYGDPSNTLMSRDTLVKVPLGVLWFGGPASDGSLFYDRHYWGPSMTVVAGRMFIQGRGNLTAVDVYTGRILWQNTLEENKRNNEGRAGNDFNGILAGFNYVAVEDGIYLVDGRDSCVRFDPRTGKEISRFTLPDRASDWGTIRIKGDLLVAEVFHDVEGLFIPGVHDKLPVEILAMDRHTGKVVWSKQARLSFPLTAIGEDRIFCFDGALEDLYQASKRRGAVPHASDARDIVALDLKTGEELWRYTTDVVGSWIGYSAAHDVMLVSNKQGITAYRGKDGSELWKKYEEGKGFRGHPEHVWDKVILWNDQVIDQRGPGMAYQIETGDPVLRRNPITQKDVPWEFTKSGHHCNYAIASPNLLTFRAADAGYCDLASGNTSRLKGFRSGCRNSLIPADGVLNAPNYAHGCSCEYSLFTSLALMHVPDSEMWSYSAIPFDGTKGSVERLGINIGAPGDRLDAKGTLWLDYPSVGGSSPGVDVTLSGETPEYFEQHSAWMEPGEWNWVASSGLEGNVTLTIGLGAKAAQERAYTVKLHFAEPKRLEPGQRVFDVSLQGRPVLRDFDVAKEAGGRNRSLIRTFSGVMAGQKLVVQLQASRGKALLCGIEIAAE